MHKQFLTKKYWLRVAANFSWFFVIYSIVSYFFLDEKQAYWSLSEIQQRFVFAFFMSTVFSYRQQEQPGFTTAGKNELVKIKWTLKDFVAISGLMLLFSIMLMSILFGLAWLALNFFAEHNEPVGKSFLKMTSVTGIMSLFAVVMISLCDRVGIRWERRS
jgi:hypothetical protein